MPPQPPPREPVCAGESHGKDTLSPQMLERMKRGCVVYKHDFNRTKRVRKLLCLSEEDGKHGKWTALRWRNHESGSGSETARTPRTAGQPSSPSQPPASPRRSFADLILTPRGSSEGGSTGARHPATPHPRRLRCPPRCGVPCTLLSSTRVPSRGSEHARGAASLLRPVHGELFAPQLRQAQRPFLPLLLAPPALKQSLARLWCVRAAVGEGGVRRRLGRERRTLGGAVLWVLGRAGHVARAPS